MKTNLIFDFVVDKDNKTVTIEREFLANRDLVWSAWTEPEILDQWWAPKPYVSKTKAMEFKVGGRRFVITSYSIHYTKLYELTTKSNMRLVFIILWF